MKTNEKIEYLLSRIRTLEGRVTKMQKKVQFMEESKTLRVEVKRR